MSNKKQIIDDKHTSSLEFNELYSDIKQLISTARQKAVTQVNQTLIVTYWHIGKRIHTQILQANRAEYGKHTM